MKKNALNFAGLAVLALIVWQWWLSRRQSHALAEHLEEQNALQRIGKASGNATLAATPPLADRGIQWLGAVLNLAQTAPQVRPDGTIRPGGSGTTEQPRNPLIFGFGGN
jgi:threonine/homoserine/homoserine lactone efflux protein